MNYLAIFLSFCFVLPLNSHGQSGSNKKVDVSGAEKYLRVADALDKGQQPRQELWDELFATTMYRILISSQVIDTNKLKSDLWAVYQRGFEPGSHAADPSLVYYFQYKVHRRELVKYIAELNGINIIDTIKRIVYPFLPKRLTDDNKFPYLFYLPYGTEESTGSSGIVINDLLLSYKTDATKQGIVAAHESFHAIVSAAFQQSFRPDVDYNLPQVNFLVFLENISEEGVADLIDKPFLMKETSPVYEELKELAKDEKKLSMQYIVKIDSFLQKAAGNPGIFNNYRTYSDFSSQFGKNGGHIPGRFMGQVLSGGQGSLQEQIDKIEDPVSFIKIYNRAAMKTAGCPLFSPASIQLLERLKQDYCQD